MPADGDFDDAHRATLNGTCHCGAVEITIPRRPDTITDCDCSICRRYGALWACFRPGK